MDMTTSPVTVELLEEYTGGDPDFLRELTDQFWQDIDERVPVLESAIASLDGARLKSVAHAIAGAAGCVGAEVLREKALALEECGKTARVSEAVPLLAEFEAELQRVRDFFAEYMA